MPISSMTGFSRVEGQFDGLLIHIELKSVNGKGLDVRCRAPGFLGAFDVKAKAIAARHLKRGNISINLSVNAADEATMLSINEDRLNSLLAWAHKLEGYVGVQSARIDGLLALPGVVENAAAVLEGEARDALLGEALDLLDEAFSQLQTARNREGEAIETVLRDQLDVIRTLVEKASASSDVQLEEIRARLRRRILELLDSDRLDEMRLEQECALLAIKHDCREELDRLRAHIDEAGRLLSEPGKAVGRRLDFLAQEFNREANTLCSKSAGTDLTRIGLDLKVAIDQMREQIQNVE